MNARKYRPARNGRRCSMSMFHRRKGDAFQMNIVSKLLGEDDNASIFRTTCVLLRTRVAQKPATRSSPLFLADVVVALTREGDF